MVSAWHVRSDNGVAVQLAVVDTVYQLHLLEDTQVQIGLDHPPQCRLESSIPTITYVI